MTKEEALALDLALEALECFDYPAHDDDVNKIQAAITAIKQARALDKKAENARELGLDYEPVVAGGGGMKDEALKLALEALEGNTTNPVIDPDQAAIEDQAINAIKQALAAQPAVPLTDEQINNIWNAKDNPQHRTTLSPWGLDRIRAIIKASLSTPPAQPAPVQDPVAIALNTGTKQGVKWLKNVEHGESLYTTPPAQPAVPDAMTSADIQEHIEYVAGWNDCRQAMLEMMK